jgi:hypothetical protein
MKKHENKMMPLSTFTQQTHQRGADLGFHKISAIDQLFLKKAAYHTVLKLLPEIPCIYQNFPHMLKII